MNALLVDDERLAREELKRLLLDLPKSLAIEVVGEASNPDEAEAFLEQTPVDVVFLDIQMPGGTGFDLLERLERAPIVIFTTAYDEYAVQAFEANALDYLLKPIEPQRLQAAVEKAQKDLDAQDEPPQNDGPLSLHDQVFIKDGDRCWFVRLADVARIESVGNYARLHFKGERALVHRSLTQLDERLDPKYFFRANRQEIINLQYIDKIEPYFSNTLLVWLTSGDRIEVSRRQSQRFKQLMSL